MHRDDGTRNFRKESITFILIGMNSANPFFFGLLFETIRQMICCNHPTEFTKSVLRRIFLYFCFFVISMELYLKKIDVMAM